MKNKEAVDNSDLEEARDRIRWGREKRSRASAAPARMEEGGP